MAVWIPPRHGGPHAARYFIPTSSVAVNANVPTENRGIPAVTVTRDTPTGSEFLVAARRDD